MGDLQCSNPAVVANALREAAKHGDIERVLGMGQYLESEVVTEMIRATGLPMVEGAGLLVQLERALRMAGPYARREAIWSGARLMAASAADTEHMEAHTRARPWADVERTSPGTHSVRVAAFLAAGRTLLSGEILTGPQMCAVRGGMAAARESLRNPEPVDERDARERQTPSES